jgi:hypothetical protein
VRIPDGTEQRCPLPGLKALIVPSPTLPTSNAPPKSPQSSGAITIPHGPSGPPVMRRLMNLPCRVKTLTASPVHEASSRSWRTGLGKPEDVSPPTGGSSNGRRRSQGMPPPLLLCLGSQRPVPCQYVRVGLCLAVSELGGSGRMTACGRPFALSDHGAALRVVGPARWR